MLLWKYVYSWISAYMDCKQIAGSWILEFMVLHNKWKICISWQFVVSITHEFLENWVPHAISTFILPLTGVCPFLLYCHGSLQGCIHNTLLLSIEMVMSLLTCICSLYCLLYKKKNTKKKKKKLIRVWNMLSTSLP